MNIGIVSTWFERGAAYVSRHYKKVLERDNDVFIYARGGTHAKGDPIWDLPEVHWGKPCIMPVANGVDKKDFLKWIAEKHIDVVFFNEQQWWPPVLWCLEQGVKTGAYIDYYTEETIPLFAAYDFLICNTKRHYDAFSWHPQCHYVPWGTDVELFKPVSSDPVSPGEVTFFQSCGFSPLRKGTDFVIQAFSRLEGPAKLILHTQRDFSDSLPDEVGLIEELQKKGRLEVIKKTVSAPGLYHLGDIYLAPSRLEGIGLPAAEALACGLPLITVDNPPMNEFIGEGCGKAAKVERLYARADGYYWPQCRPVIESLTKAMKYYLDNRHSISEYKKNARTHAEKNLNWEDRGQELSEIFNTSKKQDNLPPGLAASISQYERKRYGLRVKVAEKYPALYKVLKMI